jgi:dipeptidyl aminopeptidase/acylaminoacyl peptidase
VAAHRVASHVTALSGEPGRDIDPGDAVIAGATLDRSRAMVAFTRQTLSTPLEVHVTPLASFVPKAVSRVNAELPRHPLPRTEIVQWASNDGAAIEGLLTYPVGYEPGRRYPLVVIVRSGSVSFPRAFVPNPFQSDWVDYYPVTTLAAEGYVVLQANSRGGILPGYGPDHAQPVWAVREKAVHDVVTGVDHAVQRGLADDRALQRRGVPTEMVVYPGEGHGVTAPRNILDVGRGQVAWMNRYVRDGQ